LLGRYVEPLAVRLTWTADTRTTPTARREETRLLAEGDTAPDVTLRSDPAVTVTSSSFRGSPVILFPFTLLADPEQTGAEAYHVWGERRYAGKTSFGVERSTFVIDAHGTVAKVLRRVKPNAHADDVLAALPAAA
jgi:peroxiredoxin Q/BCP